jgi:hypothetical protein
MVAALLAMRVEKIAASLPEGYLLQLNTGLILHLVVFEQAEQIS